MCVCVCVCVCVEHAHETSGVTINFTCTTNELNSQILRWTTLSITAASMLPCVPQKKCIYIKSTGMENIHQMFLHHRSSLLAVCSPKNVMFSNTHVCGCYGNSHLPFGYTANIPNLKTVIVTTVKYGRSPLIRRVE